MCQKLLQVCDCGHMKLVCLTPCPHAISTGLQVHSDQDLLKHEDPVTNSISRSPSVVSSVLPSIYRSMVQDVSAQRQLHHEPSTSLPTPLRTGSNAGSPQEKAAPPPAFQFLLPKQQRVMSPAPGYSLPSPTLSTAPSTAPSASLPSPVPTIATQSSKLTPISPSLPQVLDEEPLIEPNYCAYHFPRYLPRSIRPCLQCYMKPEYEHQRALWLKLYHDNHLSCKPEDLEKETGLERMGQECGFGT